MQLSLGARLGQSTGPWVSREGRMLLYGVVRNGVTGFSAIVAGQPNEVRVADLTGRRGSLGASTLSTDGLYIYFEWEEPTGDLWVADLVEPK